MCICVVFADSFLMCLKALLSSNNIDTKKKSSEVLHLSPRKGLIVTTHLIPFTKDQNELDIDTIKTI